MYDYDYFDLVEEGFFFDDKKIATGFGSNKDTNLVNFYTVEKNGSGYRVPSALWASGFANLKTGMASTNMIKNGVKILTKYVDSLEDCYNFAVKYRDEYEEAANSNNDEKCYALFSEYRKLAAYMIATNRNVDGVFSGEQIPIPQSFRKALVAPFTRFQKIYEEEVEVIGASKAKDLGRAKIKTLFTKKKSKEYNKLDTETVWYCADFWNIVSKYLNTND